ncbi:MarR family winged helix-turn-helix transcriptional regulator [Flavisphingomonas formosensis]|uniref:MarR family winged helix-turn-helix transcriptional regulator n=1 Tax=Flavisphingomonas formosensis TaxID=861534 RepID=UPI0012FB3258|nr:MarR family transcriptional regulator [Sphingomonas formosensis]
MDYSDTPVASQFRLGFLIHDVSRLRRTVIDKALKPLGITRSQWWVLSNLSRNTSHEMMQTELANVLDIGKVALGGLLDRLEAGGYIERKADPADRRAKRIAMTAKGEEILEKMQEQGTELNRETLRDVTAEEIAIAEDIMHRMKKRLMEMDAELRKGGTF